MPGTKYPSASLCSDSPDAADAEVGQNQHSVVPRDLPGAAVRGGYCRLRGALRHLPRVGQDKATKSGSVVDGKDKKQQQL